MAGKEGKRIRDNVGIREGNMDADIDRMMRKLQLRGKGAGAGYGSGVGVYTGAGGVAPSLDIGQFTGSLGKGLREPCSPNRTAYFFGAELNVPEAMSWNCSPEIVDPAPTYDLSTLVPPKEICVALFKATNLTSGGDIEITFIRNRDEHIMFAWPFTIPDPQSFGFDYWAWYYIYGYIGYVEWEIFEDGDYRVEFGEPLVPPAIVLPFSITGITALPTDFDVIIQTGEGGTTVPVPGTYPVADGVLLAVSAVPNAGWNFNRFVVEPGGTFTTNPVEVMIDQNITITAVFTDTGTVPPGPGPGTGLDITEIINLMIIH